MNPTDPGYWYEPGRSTTPTARLHGRQPADWKPAHVGDDPAVAARNSDRAALASQVPTSRWLTPIIPLPTHDDDGGSAA